MAAVDACCAGANNRRLKSLSDTLKGKQCGSVKTCSASAWITPAVRSFVVGPELKTAPVWSPRDGLELSSPSSIIARINAATAPPSKQAKELVEQQIRWFGTFSKKSSRIIRSSEPRSDAAPSGHQAFEPAGRRKSDQDSPAGLHRFQRRFRPRHFERDQHVVHRGEGAAFTLVPGALS